MDPTRHLHRSPSDWLCEGLLAPYVDAFMHHLAEGRYAPHPVDRYRACIAHFARWSNRCRLSIHRIEEAVVRRFLDDHLPRCNCAKPVCKVRNDLRAALGHLLVVLRANAVIAEPPAGRTAVDAELRRFDDHMNHVRGLAPKTRSMVLRIVRDLLLAQFADRPVVISAIKPEDVRGFIARQSKLYSTPTSVGTLASALRGYFRFRATCGDPVHGLIGVVTYPANWQLASLPKTLSGAEVERLSRSLDHEGSSARRDAAIVRCALDLGLRSSEVAKLGFDDIDWCAGTVTLRGTKSRREDILPLPAATGRAIADYLKLERPQTSHRAVFVRRIAPREQPIGPDLVRKATRQV